MWRILTFIQLKMIIIVIYVYFNPKVLNFYAFIYKLRACNRDLFYTLREFILVSYNIASNCIIRKISKIILYIVKKLAFRKDKSILFNYRISNNENVKINY